uniref:NADH dehydrogenase subunit 4L n=1 Tax=Sigmella ectobioides TaxID=1670702 RepID=UPI0027A77EF6|nr:NADH dehydrogenase subunit 4L [Sigmella ectobioides]WGO57713.1 NADH dehydrogenase subunit 4L [Sigmella ectobioides]
MMIYMFVCFLSGIWVFSSNRKHLLVTLLSLEFIVLVIYFVLCVYLNMFNYELFFALVFLTFSVCEGALGLSILVLMIRSCGNDYFQSFSMLQC